MTNNDKAPEDSFFDLVSDLEEEANMAELENCSDEGLCALFQNDKKQNVANLLHYREKSAFIEGTEYYNQLKKLDLHVKSCYFCSEYYTHSGFVMAHDELKKLASEDMSKNKKLEKPKNPEEP